LAKAKLQTKMAFINNRQLQECAFECPRSWTHV